MDRQFKKIAKVTVWRDTIPSVATSFVSKQLTPGQQLEITDMQIKFKVERSLTKSPNQCDIYITNLARATRADLATRPLRVQLDAGYDDQPRNLFLGDLHFGMSEIKGPNWIALMQVGDGDRTYNHARVSKSFPSGTTVRTALNSVCASMGLTVPKNLASNPALDSQFVGGLTMHGPAREAMTKLLTPFGYHWSVQNGALTILTDDEVASTDIILVDQDHGMVGTPEFGTPPRSGKPPHVRVKNLLNPEFAPGKVVQVTSVAIDGGSGKFRIEKVTDSGDTHSNEWFSTIEIQPY